MITPANVRSIMDRLNQIARNQGTTFQDILTQYYIERALIRIVSDDFLFEHLTFKGGYVGLRIYESPRVTTDLDAVLHNAELGEIIAHTKKALTQQNDDCTWFEFESELSLLQQNEYGGHRLQYRVGLEPRPQKIQKAQILHFDFGIGDPVTPKPEIALTATILSNAQIKWKVYPVETICAEKIHTLISRGADNSRAKDIFDLAFLLPKTQKEILIKALSKTFVYRDEPVPESFHKIIISIDVSLLKTGWTKATAAIGNSTDFEASYASICNFFKVNEI